MDYYELISGIIAIIALALSGYSICISKRTAQKQLQMNFFKEYTRRYQEITIGLLSDQQNEISYQKLYIDLCSEEFYLKSQGYLPQEVWDIWYEGMRLAVKVESLQTAWKKFGGNYSAEFSTFFGNLIKESGTGSEEK